MKKLKHKLNLSFLNENDSFVQIPLCNEFKPVDITEQAEVFVEDAIVEAINPTLDFEKLRFKPFNNVDTLFIELFNKDTSTLTYSDLGFTDEDTRFLRNRFKKSFIKFNFYDSPNPTNRKLIFQSFYFTQLGSEQREIDLDLKPVTSMPVSMSIVNPVKNREGVFEGFYLYSLWNPVNFNYPKEFYMYATFNNAADGIVTPLISHIGALPVDELNSYNYVKFTLTEVGNIREYSVDDTDREILFPSNTINLRFYIQNII